MSKLAKLSTLMGKEFRAQHSRNEREEQEGKRRAEPGAKKREACGRHIPAPSLPGPPLTTHTHGSSWSTPTTVRPALGPPSRVPPRRQQFQPIGDGLCPPLPGQPIAACRDRKLFQPAGVSTDAQEVPVAELGGADWWGRSGGRR